MELALLGGPPVRSAFPQPRPRLSPAERAEAAGALGLAEWSRVADDWPLPPVDRLEARWAERHAAPHAVSVSSGTAGLTLVLRALRLPPGDEVLIPAYGCPAVDVAVLAADLVPIHVELDPDTYCLHPAATAAAVTPRTAALIAVHFAGQPAALEPLSRVADRHGLALIEDACLAPGTSLRGRAAVFSIGVGKPISAGEGGLVATRDAALASELRRLRSLGADPDSAEVTLPGGNYRLTALQAAAALPQLDRLAVDRARRDAAARRIEAAASATGCLRPLLRIEEAVHARAQLWFRYAAAETGVPRERFVEAVQAEGLPLFAGWGRPAYCHGCYTPERAAGWLRRRESDRDPAHYERTRCPHAERAAFEEAVLYDLPVLDSGPDVIADAAEALLRVGRQLALLR